MAHLWNHEEEKHTLIVITNLVLTMSFNVYNTICPGFLLALISLNFLSSSAILSFVKAPVCFCCKVRAGKFLVSVNQLIYR